MYGGESKNSVAAQSMKLDALVTSTNGRDSAGKLRKLESDGGSSQVGKAAADYLFLGPLYPNFPAGECH